jgi:hypothetical protein
MAFSVTEFKTQLGGGARPNNFSVNFSDLPAGLSLGNSTVLCKATTIPAATLGVVEIPFRGRRIKIPGDRTYAEWSATFISDSSMALHANFEAWMDFIKGTDYTSTSQSGATGLNYMAQANIIHYNDAGTAVRTYTLRDCFPTNIAQIDLSYENGEQLAEFSVTFQHLDIVVS